MVAGQLLIGHKEIRFLNPLTDLSVFLRLRSLDDVRQLWPVVWRSRWARVLAAVLTAQDAGMLMAATFMPAREAMPLLSEIYRRVRPPAVLFFRQGDSPYRPHRGSELACTSMSH